MFVWVGALVLEFVAVLYKKKIMTHLNNEEKKNVVWNC